MSETEDQTDAKIEGTAPAGHSDVHIEQHKAQSMADAVKALNDRKNPLEVDAPEPPKYAFKVDDETLEDLIFKYCRDLTALARAGKFDPITGRDDEIYQLKMILLQKGRKNAMLQAPAGVGKTALVVGLAQQVAVGNVPKYLQSARVLDLDLASMAAGTSSPAEFQERFIPLVKGIAERHSDNRYPPVIMFIDEIHQIMPTCEGSSYKGLSEVMKPYLTVGDLHVVGATTRDEYRQYVGIDPAMDRRFQKINLEVPNDEQTVTILEYLRPGYERHYSVKVPDDLLRVIVKLTTEHMRKRYQPDKSIMVMDSALAQYVMDHGNEGQLDLRSVCYVIGKETGLHPGALEGSVKDGRVITGGGGH